MTGAAAARTSFDELRRLQGRVLDALRARGVLTRNDIRQR